MKKESELISLTLRKELIEALWEKEMNLLEFSLVQK